LAASLSELKDAEQHRLAPELDRARSRCIKEYAERAKCTPDAARRIVERQHAGVLLPNVMLYFDDQAIGEVRVAQVLAEPDRYVGETLADPLEGVAYGRCKAKIMLHADGSLWIHSFAHGPTVNELKYDAKAIQDILYACNPAGVIEKLVRLLLVADVAPDKEHRLCEIACAQGGAKIRQVNARIRAAREQKKKEQAEVERQRRAAERTDPRVQLAAPPGDAEWLPVMANINEVLGASSWRRGPSSSLDASPMCHSIAPLPRLMRSGLVNSGGSHNLGLLGLPVSGARWVICATRSGLTRPERSRLGRPVPAGLLQTATSRTVGFLSLSVVRHSHSPCEQ